MLLQGDLGVLRVSEPSVIPGVRDLSWNACHVISMSGLSVHFCGCISVRGGHSWRKQLPQHP